MEIKGRIFDGLDLHSSATLTYDENTGRIEGLDETRGTGSEESVTFLPGLIDTHIHFFGTGNHNLMDWVLTDISTVTIRSVADARALLMAGFTTVRTMGDKVSISMSRAERNGFLEGPRIISSGFSLAETGGNDDPKSLPHDFAKDISYSYYCDSPWECRRAVRMNIRNGAESTKAYSSTSFSGGGNVKTELTVEELSAIVDESHKANFKAASHAYGEEAIQNSLDAGFDSIEHGLGLTEDQASIMKKKGTYYVPTLAIYTSKRRTTNAFRNELVGRHLDKDVGIAADAGVKITTGTDFLGADDGPHGQNYREIVCLSDYIGPEAAVKAGTSVAAACLGLKNVGILKRGYQADLIAVRGDPISDPTKLKPENVILVVKQGKVYKDVDGLLRNER